MALSMSKIRASKAIKAAAPEAVPPEGSPSPAKTPTQCNAEPAQGRKGSLPSHRSTAKRGPSGLQQGMLTIRQTAEYLQVCEKTVRRSIDAGELHAYQIGRQWRIPWDEIQRFLAIRANWKHYGP